MVFLEKDTLDGQRAYGIGERDEVISVETVQAVVGPEPGRTIGLAGDGAEGKQFRLAAEIIEDRSLLGMDLPGQWHQKEYEGKDPFHLVSEFVLNIQRKKRSGNDFSFRVRIGPFRASIRDGKAVSL